MHLVSAKNCYEFDHSLFTVEVDGDAKEFKTDIEYEQLVLLKHRISNKYLSFCSQSADQNQVKHMLLLGDAKCYFKLLPCFQYQTKIDSKIKFQEEFYLSTDLGASRIGFMGAGHLTKRYSKKQEQYTAKDEHVMTKEDYEVMPAFVSFAKKKFVLHPYIELQRSNNAYRLGSTIWLSHIESSRFLSVSLTHTKDEIVFQKTRIQMKLQGIAGLWVIEGEDASHSSKIRYNQKFKLRNLLRGGYLCFSKNYRLVDNQRIYQLTLEETGNEQSKFVFRSLRDEESKEFHKNSYLSLMHVQSQLYLGCRAGKSSAEVAKVHTFSQLDDEDLFRITEVDEQEEEAIRFIFALKSELKDISQRNLQAMLRDQDQTNVLAYISEVEDIYTNICNQIRRLQDSPKLLQIVQNEIKGCIIEINTQMQTYRFDVDRKRGLAQDNTKQNNIKQNGNKQNSAFQDNSKSLFDQLRSLLAQCYRILGSFCDDHNANQIITVQYIGAYVQDICRNLGAEELVMGIFRNNKSLICRVSDLVPQLGNRNVVRGILDMCRQESSRKSDDYWLKIEKILKVLNVLVDCNEKAMDINQRLIGQELFREGVFEQIFFPIRVQGDQVLALEPGTNRPIPLENITNIRFSGMVDHVLHLLSNLCENRNMISKNSIHQYLSSRQGDSVPVFLGYFSRRTPTHLYNHLLSLVTHLYIDSSPRIERYRPLAVIFFLFNIQIHSQIGTPKNFQGNMQDYMNKQQQKGTLNKKDRLAPVSNLLGKYKWQGIREPTVSEDQLVTFRETLTEKLLNQRWSKQLLEAIVIMLKLQCYTMNETIQIFHEVGANIRQGSLGQDIATKIMEILEEIFIFVQELELSKLTIFLKWKFTSLKSQLTKEEIPFVLPDSRKISIDDSQRTLNNHLHNTGRNSLEVGGTSAMSQRQHLLEDTDQLPLQGAMRRREQNNNLIVSDNFRTEYNELRDLLSQLHPTKEVVLAVIQLFISEQETDIEYISSIFRLMYKFTQPKREFLQYLMGCIVVTHQEGQMFEELHDLYKNLKHLTDICECWIANEDSEAMLAFVKTIHEFISFFFDDYELHSEQHAVRKNAPINVNRQLLLRNMGLHFPVLQLLEKNSYLLQGVKWKKEIKRKQREVFELCFEFVWDFIRDCRENKYVLHPFMSMLLQYQSLPELGQTRVYCEFYNQETEFIRQIEPWLLQATIERIIKNNGRSQWQQGDNGKGDAKGSELAKLNEPCQFNPQFIDFLLMLISNAHSENAGLSELIYNELTREGVLRKLLFMEYDNGETKLCLKMQKLKLEPLQVPIAYHWKLLKLLNSLVRSNDSIRTAFRGRLTQILKLKQLLDILMEPDIFTAQGIQCQLFFVLKRQVLGLLVYYLEKTEFHSQLLGNNQVYELIRFYETAFFSNSKKKEEISVQNEPMFLSYLEEYKEELAYFQKHPLEYLALEVHPLLRRLEEIFVKLNLQDNGPKEAHILAFFRRASEAIGSVEQSRSQKHLGLSDVKLKWRNFVDDDQENSLEEKYAKKTVLEILKSPTTVTILEAQLTELYRLMRLDEKKWLLSLIRLLKKLFEQKNIRDGQQGYIQLMEDALKLLTGYLLSLPKENIPRARECIGEQFIEIGMSLLTRSDFYLSKMHQRKLFRSVLCIFNFLLRNDNNLIYSRLFYRIFQENSLSYKFLDFLKQATQSLINRRDSDNVLQQINSCLSDMCLCVQEVHRHLDEQAFAFLTLLATHPPFTKFLRMQYAYFSVDFLEKIYNMLSFVFYREAKKLVINVSVVRAAELILDFVASMLTACNKANQNFIIDEKFPELIVQVLKIYRLNSLRKGLLVKQHLTETRVKSDEVDNNFPVEQIAPKDNKERSQLVSQITEFYEGNGIDIRELLELKIKLIDFQHPYLLNRLKYLLLRTLTECTAGNKEVFLKIRLQIPLELLKINLIWLYEDYLAEGHQYTEELVLRPRESWEKVVCQSNLSVLFLRLGFYYFSLIEIFESEDKDEEPEETESFAMNEEKEKQRIVKKFFVSIASDRRVKQKRDMLKSEEFAKQMGQYFHEYYMARDFFMSKTGHIEVQLIGGLTKIYFPLLPLCDRLDEDFQEQFRDQVDRISREEKLKSMLKLQQARYEDLQGEIEFIRQRQQKFGMLASALSLLKYEKEYMLAAWGMALLITILFLIDELGNRSFDFTVYLFVSLSPSNFLRALMLLVSILMFCLGLLNALYLFVRKIPLQYRLLSKQFAKNKEPKEGWQHTVTFYIWSRILSSVAYNLYVIVFLLATLVHPFFAGFLLVEVISRIEMGRFIITSIKETWFQFMAVAGLLLISNFAYASYIYDFQTSDVGYGDICKDIYRCVLFMNDQSFKNGSGLFGSAITVDYNYMYISIKLLGELAYLVFIQKVIFEIFAGTVFDKFSQLREKKEKIDEDEDSSCFICGQERFDLDLDLEGFEQHTTVNHNVFRYISYLFYLRRLPVEEHGIVEKIVYSYLMEASTDWLPEGTSILKQAKQELEQVGTGIDDPEQERQDYCKEKLSELKSIRMRISSAYADLERIKAL